MLPPFSLTLASISLAASPGVILSQTITFPDLAILSSIRLFLSVGFFLPAHKSAASV